MQAKQSQPRPGGAAGQAVRIDLGVVRCFGDGDLGLSGQVSGWAAPEDAHCWNDGPEAVLQVVAQQPEFRCVLVIGGAALVNKLCPRQDMTVFVNGYRLGFWRLMDAQPVQLEVMIEPGQWHARGKDATLSLAFHMPGSLRLSTVQPHGDDRELGFCFHTIALFPAPHER